MQLGRIAASVLFCTVMSTAQLLPETVVRLNACLGAQTPVDLCYDRLRLQASDGSPLSVKVTLSSPAVQAQLNVVSNTQAGYGVLRAATSSTLSLSGQNRVNN